MYAFDADHDDTPTPARRPTYGVAALRRMPTEDQLDAAMANLRRTGRARWGKRADNAARRLAVSK